MTDNVIKIEVDGRELAARPGQMLIEVTDANDIYIPRFCYHKKLSVAANCRMCLVEVEKAPKPLPACATPVTNGMKVRTRSPLALAAQKSVMEFLLINHPLDCPICDQGGECELQDLAMGYGSDVSRYQENKRVVKDKNIGPLVQTDMTRCIHCTRCVRFGEEVAGLRELGGTGRGEDLLIGTYIEKSMTSELSGNIIDLCPVGALTSKPFRFSARTWEMRQFNGIAPHDGVGSNIHFHTKGNVVKRVVPAENEAINEVWLSDRDRFSYEGLYSDDRLQTPMIKQDGVWRETDWLAAFEHVKHGLDRVITARGAHSLGALASANATSEELYLLQKFMRALGSNNIDHRIHQCDFSDEAEAPLFPWLGLPIQELEQLDAALIVGGNPRKDQPLINHRLRKAANKGAAIMVVNPVDFASNFNFAAKAIVTPADMTRTLAGIVKALLDAGKTSKDQDLLKLIQPVQATAEHKLIAGRLAQAKNSAVLLGTLALSDAEYSSLRYLCGHIALLCGARLGYLPESANSTGAWLSGALPHRRTGGAAVAGKGLNAAQMLAEKLPAYLLLNLEPELDCWDGTQALTALEAAECVIAMTPYVTATMKRYADVLLPITQYAENEGSYINMAGTAQSFAAIVKAPGAARPAWKVLRVLGNTFELDGFNYNSVQQVSAELNSALGNIKPDNNNAWRKPEMLAALNGTLIRITERPVNSVDPLVRRAQALQETGDVADGAVHVSRQTAKDIGVANGGQVQVEQQGRTFSLPLRIDDRLPARTVLIQGGKAPTGPWFGEVKVTKM
ncbi:MAG: NADH-quinone oxidoreductase subunit G [Gammaproteobacteria bacterium RIFCSPLOWO2_12_FULL_52_10]|nr:MAG: NADH-quinone oxidoreductase subunit G [Gammaproteobacteria bacterium RIFCSPLOWO2_12_FULL_52_10]